MAYEDRNTDEDREVDDASDDEQGRGCGVVHVFGVFGYALAGESELLAVRLYA